MKSLAPILMASLLAAFALQAQAQGTNAADGLGIDSFQIIAQKNIFDPTRTRRRSFQTGPRIRVERVSLVGTSVDNGDVAAFFAGDGVPDRPLKPGDAVKDFKIVQITEDGVRLAGVTNTNTFVLDFENRRSLRREEKGPWQGSSDLSDPVAITSSDSDDTAPSATGSAPPSRPGESDIERRLRLKREQEK